MVSEDSQEQERFVQEFVEAMKEALCFDVAKLTGIKEFPQLRVDFKVGTNYHSLAAFKKRSTELGTDGSDGEAPGDVF